MISRSWDLKKILILVGFVLIVGTLALNQRLITQIFATDRLSIPEEVKTGIIILDAVFVLLVLLMLIQHKSKAKLLIDAGVGLGFTLILLLGMEGCFYYLNTQYERQRQLGKVVFEFMREVEDGEVMFRGEHNRAFFRRDEWLGYTLVPEMQARASRKNGDETLYDVIYTTDSYGRRVTSLSGSDSRPYFILFFGDSFVFGEGVHDHETMPSYVSRLVPDYRAYNYGVAGYGPQHMLAQLQRPEMKAEVEEEEGILIYTFIGEHVSRAAGSMRIHNQRGEIMPYYYFDDQVSLIRQGNFVSGRPLLSILYRIAGYSQTLLYFNIDFPPRVRTGDLETTVKIIEAARQVYQEKFNSDRFVVLIYPGLGLPEILPYLQAAEIEYLDYSGLSGAYEPEFWLGEGHPTAKAHRTVAEKLVQELGLVD